MEADSAEAVLLEHCIHSTSSGMSTWASPHLQETQMMTLGTLSADMWECCVSSSS